MSTAYAPHIHMIHMMVGWIFVVISWDIHEHPPASKPVDLRDCRTIVCNWGVLLAPRGYVSFVSPLVLIEILHKRDGTSNKVRWSILWQFHDLYTNVSIYPRWKKCQRICAHMPTFWWHCWSTLQCYSQRPHIGPILSRPPFGEVDLTETKNKGAG